MSTLLISDLHLSPQCPAVSEAFFNLLKNESVKFDSLYILGDLFDTWIGDDDPEPFSHQVISALKKLSDSGVSVYLMQGNRDFLIGKKFSHDTGCILLGDYHVCELEGKKVLLLHGDTLCTRDKQYQRYRHIARSGFLRWVLMHLPLKVRQRIAAKWRSQSIESNSNKSENIMDVSPQEVEKIMEKYCIDTIIHGHTHRPNRHKHLHGERLVLGDWGQNGWFVRITDKTTIELVSFEIQH
jgi:UDP-2,3-diacylglucosamine hydrolase